ncbi:DUF2378 family protein [Hyalangium minutum]|uniref:Uncharacterized protein n=1 Tax=Hyalangium minutum TaxID=394096 RepID=A0A085WIP8_9BACT|nr:DUF2378 family protein [Hyalangium minutum]KFE67561.1 hypothetical protein DB31_8044 [Hyalangium minutum]
MVLETSQEIGREPVVFGHALETLLAEAEVLAPHTLDEFARLGLSPLHQLEVAYPVEVWSEALRILVQALSADVGTAAAEFLLGQRYSERSLSSRIGSAMNAHAKVVGPERTLMRTARNLRMVNNFFDATVRELPGGRGWELVTKPLVQFALSSKRLMDPPHFLRGVLSKALEAAGAKGVRMELVEHDEVLGTATFHIFF